MKHVSASEARKNWFKLLVALVQKSLDLGWTRDPFDRLIASHSLVRRIPLCSVDAVILENHKLLVPELR